MAHALPGVMAVNAASSNSEANAAAAANENTNASDEDQRAAVKAAGKIASPIENTQGGGNGNKKPPNNTTGGNNNGPEPTSSPSPEKRYSGKLIKVNKPDADADALAEKLKGQSRVSFANDPNKREFDVVSDEYIAQTKVIKTLGSDFRAQAKATFEAAKQTGRKVYYELSPNTSPEIIKKINEYSTRFGVPVKIEYKSN
jgi:hypothetical protein